MYYPYFRGKQYDLLTVRECAPIMAAVGFVPIIEPVKESLGGLKRAIDAVKDSGGEVILVVNPHFGDHSGGTNDLSSFVETQLEDSSHVTPGILLKTHTSPSQLSQMIEQHKSQRIAFLHAGYSDVSFLLSRLGEVRADSRHVFFENVCGKLYRKHFRANTRVLLRDGFHRKKKNSEYANDEQFSDLHVTFGEEGMSGFGDFLIVGDDYDDKGGGPAYTVAIHLTYIDHLKDDEMFIKHFKSDRQDSPTDPAGKFAEALRKLVSAVEENGSKIQRTPAVEEFLEFHRLKHYPGLGYIKKMSMSHHIVTLARFFGYQEA